MTVDKNPAYPITVEELRKEKKMPLGIQLRHVKYLNNIVEQDHRFIKKASSFDDRIEILSHSYSHYFLNRSYAYGKKRKLFLLDKSVQNQVEFIHQLFGIVA